METSIPTGTTTIFCYNRPPSGAGCKRKSIVRRPPHGPRKEFLCSRARSASEPPGSRARRPSAERPNTRVWRAERLEPRTLLAFGPAGPEFQVSFEGIHERGAADGSGIAARRYDAQAVPQGLEMTVNPTAAGSQRLPAMAADATGDFVVVFADDANGVRGQRYDATGAKVGGNFLVGGSGQTVTGTSVAMTAAGGFTVAWTDGRPGVRVARFSPSGAPLGPEFVVTPAGNRPVVGMNAGAHAVIVWKRGGDVLAQRYDNLGAAVGGEIVIASGTGSDDEASVDVDASGDFVVTWVNQEDVFARRYNADGTPQSPAVLVNPTTPLRQEFAGPTVAVAVDDSGDAVVVWSINGEPGFDEDEVYRRRFDAGPNPEVSGVWPIGVPEGDAGTSLAELEIKLSHPSVGPTIVNWQTGNITTGGTPATAGEDYTASAGVVTFERGQTSKSVFVPILGDTKYEWNERFELRLTSADGATISPLGAATGATIFNDDGLPRVSVTPAVAVDEGDAGTARSVVLAVSLSHQSDFPVDVSFTTVDGSATEGQDYLGGSGLLRFVRWLRRNWGSGMLRLDARGSMFAPPRAFVTRTTHACETLTPFASSC